MSVARRAVGLAPAAIPDDARSSGERRRPLLAPTPAIIVLVDDDPDVRAALRRALGPEVHVVEASTVASGVRAVARERWSGLIADYELPDGTCIDVLRAAGCSHGAGPVVVLTGHQPETITPLLAAEADLAFKTAPTDGALEVRSKIWPRPELLVFRDRALLAHGRRYHLGLRVVHEQFGHLELPARPRALLEHLACGGTVETFQIDERLGESSAKALSTQLLRRTGAGSIGELAATLAHLVAELA